MSDESKSTALETATNVTLAAGEDGSTTSLESEITNLRQQLEA
jgi:hypothetical protein